MTGIEPAYSAWEAISTPERVNENRWSAGGRANPKPRLNKLKRPEVDRRSAWGGRPVGLDWVDSVVSDIENAGIDDLVIVGHSLAGLTVPGVVTKLGPVRAREMIPAAAFLPPDGAAFVDTMPRALGLPVSTTCLLP
jgi:hypothetical protein